VKDADDACQLIAAVGEGLAGDGDDFEFGRESAQDFNDLGAVGVLEPEVENDEGSMVRWCCWKICTLWRAESASSTA